MNISSCSCLKRHHFKWHKGYHLMFALGLELRDGKLAWTNNSIFSQHSMRQKITVIPVKCNSLWQDYKKQSILGYISNYSISSWGYVSNSVKWRSNGCLFRGYEAHFIYSYLPTIYSVQHYPNRPGYPHLFVNGVFLISVDEWQSQMWFPHLINDYFWRFDTLSL